MLNENEDRTYQNLWDTTKTALGTSVSVPQGSGTLGKKECESWKKGGGSSVECCLQA